MKKFILLALLCIPVTSFAASSVRVLGTKTANSGTGVSAAPTKVLPVKTTSVAADRAAGARVGTIRTAPKVTSNNTITANKNVSTSASTSAARFPVITPAHSYDSVKTPQVAGGTTVVNAEEDPRVDMIHMGGDRENYWRNVKNMNGRVSELVNDGYVFMWVEDANQ